MAAVVLGPVVDCIMRHSQWKLDVLNPEVTILSYSSLWKLRSFENESKVSPNSLWNSVRTWEYWSADSSCRPTCCHHPKWLLSPPARTRIFSSRNNGVMCRQTRRQRRSFHCTSWWKHKNVIKINDRKMWPYWVSHTDGQLQELHLPSGPML